jgi:hypothetical protein
MNPEQTNTKRDAVAAAAAAGAKEGAAYKARENTLNQRSSG